MSSSAAAAAAANPSGSLYATPRPWSQLLDFSAFSRPHTYADAMLRATRNITYFKYNYVLFSLLIIFFSLFWNPFAMIVYIVLFIAWYLLYLTRDRPPVLFDQPLDDGTVLFGLALVTFLVLVLVGVGLNLFLSCLVIFVLVGLHAAFRVTDDLFLDEQSAAQNGLLSAVASQPITTTYARI